MNEVIIGIDLGTTNSEVAVLTNGEITVIGDDGGKILPSYVGVDDKGGLLVGEVARNQYVVYPERTVKSIKRRMGEEIRVRLGSEEYSPQEISAIILKRLKEMAEKELGHPVTKAVITVPAYFSDRQRQATREAGQIAGLDVVKMINEPTAAALVYESGHKGGKRIMVYDLGGGTFDVSVVQIEDDVIEVVSSHGDNQLGGDDFDKVLAEHILHELHDMHGVEDEEIPAGSMARIRRAAESAKIRLSDNPFAMVEEEYLLEKEGVPIHLQMEIARHDYEAMINIYIDETMDAIHRALRDAGLTASDIDEILLVGGSTRTPLIRTRLEREFGMTPRGEIDPDLCVASGAAMQAAMISGVEVNAVLVDVTPYSFGVSVLGEIDGVPSPHMYVPLIKKNSPIPVSKSEVFYTAVPNQEVVEVRVFQGEEKDVRNNIEIGNFLVEGLSEGPAGSEIIASFSLDTNGILEVSAREKATGLAKSITIDNAIARFDKDELEQARNKVKKLFGEEETEQADEKGAAGAGGKARAAAVQARALIEKAEKLMDTADDEDKEEMVELIESVQEAIEAADSDRLREAMDDLSEIIFYLES